MLVDAGASPGRRRERRSPTSRPARMRLALRFYSSSNLLALHSMIDTGSGRPQSTHRVAVAYTDFDEQSVLSWSREDDFDRKAAANVVELFDRLDSLLFSDALHPAVQPTLSQQIQRECATWTSRYLIIACDYDTN